MNISWFGQSCFRIESKDAKILIDPFSKEVGLKVPKLSADLILSTHNHFDHANLDGINPEAFVINTPGEYEKMGVQVVGILSYHDNVEGRERGLNTIFLLKTEDIAICHLGDLGQHNLSSDQIESIGEIDILLIPVGGTYTIDGETAYEIVKEIEPKIVIPMHYKVPDLAIELDGPEKFIKSMGIKSEEIDILKIQAKNLPQDETKLYILKI